MDRCNKKQACVTCAIFLFVILGCVFSILYLLINANQTKTVKPNKPTIVKPEPKPDVKPPCPCQVPCPKPKVPSSTRPKPNCCGPVKVLAFTSEWCGPCKEAKKKISSLVNNNINVQYVDIDKNPSMARKYTISLVPTFIFNKNGKEIKTNSVDDILMLSK